MPIVRELFGTPVAQARHRGQLLKARCPHMDGAFCNGGGNRDMARWDATEQPLAPFFDASVGKASGGFIPCKFRAVFVPFRQRERGRSVRIVS